MKRSEQSPGRFSCDDRGVSEVIAFVLVFGIILSSVALLSMTGFQAMEDYQENEQLQNAERAMDALAENYNDVLQHSAIEERYAELSLREGTVSTGSSGTEVTVSINGESIHDNSASNFYDPNTDSVSLGEFAYTTGSDTVAYDGGAVVRESEFGSAVVRQPHLTCNDDRAIISLVAIDADERSIQSSDGLGFTMSVENRTTEVYDEDIDNVSVSAGSSPAQTAWEDHILDRGNWDEGECTADEVLVTVVEVSIEY
ncbi:uncharacterized protein Nmag_3143 [Natrialba magadii ATCC 43099]|uniref:Uncharacterized protein n=1 Tax=Natrialba magadii (strain ATCC 43099 / DSM 3394 / CCM 3739 / CIP 104546 / IAM 13178 / JCM 8861 / NBRC 102185 / NCIMB 2190 / MS3) TaxID=547559 RepID=D3SRS1_NATMM|nr:hypothetical protein [Natrialba magadii]ADD06695.1 uncharacterized protein Nmag_3143 [Natrialba magadii ATCC 43099]ELY31844.1 hypothetical protein C500_04683 [Natrialba magadii ATCC 43099]